MHARRPSLRLTTAVLLLLHLLGGAGAALAEAQAELRSPVAAHHLTGEEGDDCPPVHSHVDCQICRVLRLGAAPASAVQPLSPAGALSPRTDPSPETILVSAFAPAALGARAPPVPTS